jgi:hypothetical protein
VSPEELYREERLVNREAEFKATGRRYGRPGRRADEFDVVGALCGPLETPCRRYTTGRDFGDESIAEDGPYCDWCKRYHGSDIRCPFDPASVVWVDGENKRFKPVNGADVLGWNKIPEEPKAKLPTDSAARKEMPMARGLLDYFPLALAEVASCSYRATQQHHPDKEMHWDKSKSTDHADCIVRHCTDRGTRDTDGEWHDTKLAWRALANLQEFLERKKA